MVRALKIPRTNYELLRRRPETSQSTAAWTSATSLNTALSLAVTNLAMALVSFQASGTITAGAITFELSDAGSNWYPVQAYRVGSETSESSYTLTGANQVWMVPVGGATNIRVRLSTVITGSGTANIGLSASAAPFAPDVVAVGASLPAGSNTIGAVSQASGPWTENLTQIAGTAVDTNSGTKSAGTQRVVIATDQPQLTNALKVDGSAVTQPVSASSLPLPTGAATSAKTAGSGHAGTPSADVISVQGVTSMTALKVDGSAVTQPVWARHRKCLHGHL